LYCLILKNSSQVDFFRPEIYNRFMMQVRCVVLALLAITT
jgi:hypothetical protein